MGCLPQPRAFWPVILVLAACGGSSSDSADQGGAGPVAFLAPTFTDSAGALSVLKFESLPTWEDERLVWTLSQVRTLSAKATATSDPLVLSPERLVVLPSGNIVVADGAEHHLVVLGPMGDSALARFGRSGAGPGEIASVGMLWIEPDGNLGVADYANSRISRFTLEGRLVGESRYDGRVTWWDVRPRTDQLFGERFAPNDGHGVATYPRSVLVTIDPKTGKASSPLITFPPPPPLPKGARAGMPVIYFPRLLWTVLTDGAVVVMRSDDPRITVHGADGKPLREIRLPWSPRPVSDQDMAELREEAGPLVQLAGITVNAEFPLATGLLRVNDSIVALAQSDAWGPAEEARIPAHRTVWRLFTESGAYAGVVRFPERFSPMSAADGLVVGLQMDDLDVPTLVELRLEPPRSR